ncbi:MAG: Rpp14/Pop5 family protein [Sulfolobales archaeon]
MLLERALLISAVAISLAALYLGVSSWLKVRGIASLVRSTLSSSKAKVAKPRRRYLVFEIIAVSGDLSHVRKDHVEKALQRSFQLLFGLVGYGAARPSLVYYDESKGAGILTFKHLWRNHVFLMLSLIKEINGVKVFVIPVATTGTRKKAMKALKRT